MDIVNITSLESKGPLSDKEGCPKLLRKKQQEEEWESREEIRMKREKNVQ